MLFSLEMGSKLLTSGASIATWIWKSCLGSWGGVIQRARVQPPDIFDVLWFLGFAGVKTMWKTHCTRILRGCLACILTFGGAWRCKGPVSWREQSGQQTGCHWGVNVQCLDSRLVLFTYYVILYYRMPYFDTTMLLTLRADLLKKKTHTHPSDGPFSK